MGALAPGVVPLLSMLALAAPARSEEPPAPPAEAADAAPAPGEEIVVTATRGPRPLRRVPSAVTVLPRVEVARSPAKTADELLVSIPAFGLFRRSSSMAADPTSQGVNLRGVSLSGISRSLVLVDGVPSNDAFAGWVNWRSVPAIGIQRVEVAPGGGSALYGNYALGGVTQNLGRARIRGVEADAAWRFAPRWLAAAAYTYLEPTVTRAPDQEALVGRWLPQVPNHRASLSVAYDDPSFVTGSVQLRYLGAQYEDALNTQPMAEVLLVDLYGAWHATRSADLFLAVQNLFDETYVVGKAGVDTVGQPRFVHGGVRFRTGG